MAKRVRLAALRDEAAERKTLFLLKALCISPFESDETHVVYKGVWDPDLGHERVREAERSFPDSPSSDMDAIMKPVAFRGWSTTDDVVKATYFQRVIQERVEDGATGLKGYTLNVNLSPEVLADIEASSSTFMKTTQERVARHIKTRMERSVDFWFGLDISPSKRPHLHGAFAVHPIEVPFMKDALEAASRVRGQEATKRAVVVDEITDAAGWARYSTKTWRQARAHLKCKTITASSELRHQAQQHYERDQEAYRMASFPELIELM